MWERVGKSIDFKSILQAELWGFVIILKGRERSDSLQILFIETENITANEGRELSVGPMNESCSGNLGAEMSDPQHGRSLSRSLQES